MVAGAALYLSLYRECQGWFDLGRVDAFYVMMTLLALWVTRKAHPVVAAIFWVLAVETKQPILPVAVLMLCHDYRRVGRTVAGLLVFFVGVAVSYGLINRATGGWYSLYILREPKANAALLLRPGFTFLPENVLAPLGIACLVLAAAVLLVPGRWGSRATRFWVTAVGSTVLLTWYQMMHNGSSVNVLMPMYAVLAAAFAWRWRGCSGVYRRCRRESRHARCCCWRWECSCWRVATIPGCSSRPRHCAPRRGAAGAAAGSPW